MTANNPLARGRFESPDQFKKLILILLSFPLFSSLISFFVKLNHPQFIIRWVIHYYFIKRLKVKTDEIEKDISQYRSVLDFFIRRLKKGSRPIPKTKNIFISPVDGEILAFGGIKNGALIQAKGKKYKLLELVGKEDEGKFAGGHYLTIYLAPVNYHRIHHPLDAQIIKTDFFPGALLPVNHFSINNFSDVFTKNKRVITYYRAGKKCFALVKIGALNVGNISLSYDRLYYKNIKNKPFRDGKFFSKNYGFKKVTKGNEAAVFNLGSTVILLFERNTMEFCKLKNRQKLRLGDKIGKFNFS